MIRSLYKLLLLIFLSVIVTSCDSDKGRFMPYTTSHYGVDGAVKSIIEQQYSNKSQLIYTEQYDFDTSGRLLSYQRIEDTDTVSLNLKYNRHGRITHGQGKNSRLSNKTQYIPKFNAYGDLIKETYLVLNGSDFEPYYSREYEYDTIGHVINIQIWHPNDSVKKYIDYIYENNKLIQIKYHFDNEYVCDCDTSGLVISESVNNKSDEIICQNKYTYKFDENGNWIERVQKIKKRLQSTTKRDIVYYSEAELTAANIIEPPKPYTKIAFIDNYINNVLTRDDGESNTPNKVLLIVLITCTIIATAIGWYLASAAYGIFDHFTGQTQTNGMKRLWMYNYEPYTKIGSLLFIAFAAFVASIILILLVGGIIWGILWLVKIILLIIIIIGWICLIGGGISIFSEDAQQIGCLALILGIIIVVFQNTIEAFGEAIVQWGFEFMQSVNMFEWGLNLFKNYWDIILLIFFTPMALFLTFAIFVIFLNLLLNGFEFLVTRIYSIRRPCPSCGSTATPDYIIGGKPHPVKLHPGIYGVFTHRSPVTKQNIPTMLINGRGKITRQCKKCHQFIKADTDNTIGTEIHIGIVGHRSSGKTYLLYSGLSSLMKSYPDRISQIDANDDAIHGTKIETKKRRIDAREDIQTNVANQYRATQLIVKRKLQPVPYHLFFYDVAGEKFNVNTSHYKTAMDFYRNVQSIVFIIDPHMLDISGTTASTKFINWHKKHAASETHNIDGAFTVLKDIFETVGKKSKKVDFNFVCTKTDLGYLTELGYSDTPNEEATETFISTELGLTNLINKAKDHFKNVHFYAVSVTDSDESKVKNLFISLLAQRNVSI